MFRVPLQIFVLFALVAAALAGHVLRSDHGIQYQYDNQKTGHGWSYPSHIIVPSGSYKFAGGYGGLYGGYGGYGLY